MGGILEMANHRLYPFWGHLTEALRTGMPQNEARTGDTPMFEALYADPARLKQFLAAMSGISRGAAMAIAAKFPGRNTKPSATSAPRRATPPPRSLSLIPISTASDSTCLKSGRSSRSTSKAWASPSACVSRQAASSTLRSPQPTSS